MNGALFSPGAEYRYRLWRHWKDDPNVVGSYVCFVMLNPSTADEFANDPTIERCERRARMWGYDGLEVVNLFALRSTDPKALLFNADPIGPENDVAILAAVRAATLIVCGWGEHGRIGMRGLHVCRNLRRRRIALHALKINKSGEPAHPLYLPYALGPIAFGPSPAEREP